MSNTEGAYPAFPGEFAGASLKRVLRVTVRAETSEPFPGEFAGASLKPQDYQS